MTRDARERVLALHSWHHDWRGLRVAVLGLGGIGFSVADTLVELGSRVRVLHDEEDRDRERLLDVIGAERVLLTNDSDRLDDLEAFDPELLVVASDLHPNDPLIAWAQRRGTVIWGDTQLGWRLRDKTSRIADWICVTGTVGKTTTTELAARMLLAGGLRVAPVGGEDLPILDALRDPQGYDALVIEFSSAQLHRLGEISPLASACLNLGEERQDRLDWHGSYEAYAAALASVYEHTQIACVYNRTDPATEQMVAAADVIEGARAISFGIDSPPPSGFGLVEDLLVDRGYHAERRNEAFELVALEELQERGLGAPAIVQSILAAAALARARGVEPSEIAQAILSMPSNGGGSGGGAAAGG